jgi:hypothetical protein
VGPSHQREQRKGKREWWCGPARGRVGGLLGRLGRKVRRVCFSFISFLFQTPFKTTFLFKFKSNSFKLFLKDFINFLETTQATKNHAKPTDDAQSLVVSILIK